MQVISADVLSIALYGQQLTTDFMQKALSTVHQKDIEDWQQNYTCHNRYSILRRMDKELEKRYVITYSRLNSLICKAYQ